MMIKELKKIEKLLFGTTLSQISNLIEDEESKEYFGYNFEADNLKFKFRKSKITPKKVGQFVTLWKRNSKNETEPFSESDNFDFYIVLTEENKNYGFFLFPKNELVKRQILSTKLKEGKRGFRVYPKWTNTENKQAEKTQIWQTNYFLDFTNENNETIKRLTEILTNK
jgi:hypothetical protein